MFDQVYTQKCEELQYQTNINRSTIQYIFIMYLLNIIVVDISFYIIGQTSKILTFWPILYATYLGMEGAKHVIQVPTISHIDELVLFFGDNQENLDTLHSR